MLASSCFALTALGILLKDQGDYVKAYAPFEKSLNAACAAALATEIIVDLYTFFRPPAPYQHLFVLDPRQEAGTSEKAGIYAVNGS